MGAVYQAVDDVLEREVAVKVIRHDVEAPLNLAARFRQEARAAAGFAHPHVVRIYDFGIDRDRHPFLVMELLEGDTLRQRLSGGRALAAARSAARAPRRLLCAERGTRAGARPPRFEAGEHLSAASHEWCRAEGARFWSRQDL